MIRMKHILILIIAILLMEIGSAQNYLPESAMEPGADLTFNSGYARNATENIINVMDYGASADGVTDDYAVFAAAVTAAGDGNGLVYVPSGTYRLSTGVTVPSNTSIFGNGYSTKIITDGNGFVISSTTGVRIRDMYLYGPGSGSNSGITAGNVTNTIISGMFIQNYGFMGFYGGAVNNSIITENIVSGNGKDESVIGQGIHIGYSGTAESHNVTISNNICFENGNIVADWYGGSHGIYVSGLNNTYNIIVIGNICNSNTGAGINVNGGTRTSVIGNICSRNRYKGIAIAGYAYNSIIACNRVDYVLEIKESTSICGSGISVGPTTYGIHVADNTISDVARDGILVYGNGVTINGNSIIDANYSGIALNNVNMCSIDGNHIENITNYGIYAVSCDNLSITSNFIKNVSWKYGSGIYFSADFDDVSIVGNYVADVIYGIGSTVVSSKSGQCKCNMFVNTTVATNTGFRSSGIVIAMNSGEVSEASGNSIGTGSSQTIAHGLYITPKRVSVTPTASGASWTAYADATNIYANVTNGKPYNWAASTW